MTTTVDAPTASAPTDEVEAFGYHQAFQRTIKSFSSFAIGFSFMSITSGIFTTYAFLFGTSGPRGIWMWLVASVGQLLVTLIGATWLYQTKSGALSCAQLHRFAPSSGTDGGTVGHHPQIRAPFRRLQRSHRISMLRAVFDPPFDTGMMWSNSSLLGSRSQRSGPGSRRQTS